MQEQRWGSEYMTDTNNDAYLRPWSAATYQIEVEGQIRESWIDCFPGMRITSIERADESIFTCMIGRVMDQSELSGILNGLAELHLPIISVKKVASTDRSYPVAD